MSHTPGPWRACKNGECSCGYIFGEGGEVYVAQAIGEKNVDEYGCPDPHPLLATQKANARLIAKAPEQYECLKQIRRIAEDEPDSDVALGQILGVCDKLIAQSETNK